MSFDLCASYSFRSFVLRLSHTFAALHLIKTREITIWYHHGQYRSWKNVKYNYLEHVVAM